ncbi:copper-fist-domain-containing protein [Hesseltinella vesiculosa]|uniref:Copper-fist-domain-containing protein n=1 Tax=Hesseltinella vesiculosa TaxID=101127 RepID=A0A1X2GYU3_9FUNG|nr:copper-fist-domain-containing protein [Hesseltinella vesiculosa]
MVYIQATDGSMKKYACLTCIKGHRSTSCQHADRELVEIRKKGRPVSQCAECRNLRKTKQVHIKCMCKTSLSSIVKRDPYPTQQQTIDVVLSPPANEPARRLSVIDNLESEKQDLELDGKRSQVFSLHSPPWNP